MDNFIFSEDLELSIIEHRLETLFGYLQRVGQIAFFPALIFNETFWKLPLPKRLVIVSNSQEDWIGENPENLTYFIIDRFFLDLLKTIKVTYFSYTKFSLSALIKILLVKNKFSITDFQSFGEIKDNNLLFFNNFILNSNPTFDEQKDFLGKIFAIKFYSKFINKSKAKVLVLIYDFYQDSWEAFFKSLEKIDEKQKTNLLKNTDINFAFINEHSLKPFEEKVAKNNYLKDLFDKSNFKYDTVDIYDFKLKEKFNFIILDEVLSVLPTNIFKQFNNDFYDAQNRLTFKDRTDYKKVVEKVAAFNSPLRLNSEVTDEDLFNIDIELTWDVFENRDLINLIDSNKSLIERTYFRFSLTILKVIVELIKSLEKDGVINILDFGDSPEDKFSLGLLRDQNNISRLPLDFELYLKILDSFEDISITTQLQPTTKLLEDEIYEKTEETVKVSDLLTLIYSNPKANKDFFDIENFEIKDQLKTATQDFRKSAYLKQKGIMFFGLPTYFYKKGLKGFHDKIKTNPELSSLLSRDELVFTNQSNYEQEFLVNIFPTVMNILEQNKNIVIAKDNESKRNKKFDELLSTLKLNKLKILHFISAHWEELSKNSKENPDSYQSLEISLK